MIATFFTKSNPVHYIFAFIYLSSLFFIKNSPISIVDYFVLLVTLLSSILLIKFIVSKNILNKKNNYSIVAVCFLIGLTIEESMSYKALFSNIFLLLAIRKIFSLRTPININKKVFDAVFWILIASTFYSPTILFLILLIVTLLLYSQLNLNNIIVIVLAIISAISFLYILEISIHPYSSFFSFINQLFFEVTSKVYSELFFNQGVVIDSKWNFNFVLIFIFIFLFLSLYIWKGYVKTNEHRRSTTLILLTTILSLIIFNLAIPETFIFFLFSIIVIFTSYLESCSSQVIKSLILILCLAAPYFSILF